MVTVTIQYLNNNLLKNYLGKSNVYREKIDRCIFNSVCNYTTINFYEYLNMRR